ncbi:hypothetical protein ABT158_41385 [Nonomuraea sp. NPDC001636]|uniref:hypothetical protein n=1 Tax=Nonomuraea sp. NPDC001636 TaxID=3154391 RepID=UPI0033230AEC
MGRVAAEREWEPARAHAVERAVTDHRTLATTVLHTDAETPAQTLARLLATCGTS